MKAWAFRIMHNCHINLIRRKRLFPVGDPSMTGSRCRRRRRTAWS